MSSSIEQQSPNPVPMAAPSLDPTIPIPQSLEDSLSTPTSAAGMNIMANNNNNNNNNNMMNVDQPTPPTMDGTPSAPAADLVASPFTTTTTMPSNTAGPGTTSNPVKKGQQTSKATASRSRDSRLPSSSKRESVFDRLYRTQTAASRSWQPARTMIRKNTYKHPRTPTSKPNLDDAAQIFNRLHITGTVANTSKKLTPRAVGGSVRKANNNIVMSKKRHTTTSTTKFMSPHKNIPSTSTPMHTNKRLSPKSQYVYSPRMKPLTKLYFDSKYHPGIGLESVDPIKLGYSFFQTFCDYENGALTCQQIAREIIVAFFKKDFPSGRHWELHEPLVEEREGEQDSFNVKMWATFDWESKYQEALAQGVVRCFPSEKEIRVMNYIYDINS